MIDNSIFLFRNQAGGGKRTIKGTSSSQGSCRVGCTHEEADNFDSTAEYDDGSCVFDGTQSVIPDSYQYNLGCMDAGASNFNPNAEYDDGYQCSYIGGCLKPNAVNYNANADYDNGSCVFDGTQSVIPESVQYTLGCLDPQSMSYNPNADYDDGNQCIYVGGCMNSMADNFDPSAQYDDGSCVFSG
jgi:hypothetical protein